MGNNPFLQKITHPNQSDVLTSSGRLAKSHQVALPRRSTALAVAGLKASNGRNLVPQRRRRMGSPLEKALKTLTGWWLTYPSGKYESQWQGLSHMVKWKIKNVWNHQPVND